MSELQPPVDHLYEDEDEPVTVWRRPRKLEEAEMDITPMIDITFLLLIFFLVASRMDADAGVELSPARYGIAVAAKEAVIITVARAEGGEAQVYKGDGKSPPNLVSGNFAEQEEELVKYVEAGLRDTPPKKHVIVKAERGVKQRDVARVDKAVGRTSLREKLYVAVLEEK